MSKKAKAGTMKDEGKRALKPKLRFPEFRDAPGWGSQPIGDFANILKGKGVSKADLATDGDLPCIRYGELYTHYGEVIETVLSRTNIASNNLVMSVRHDVIIPASGETKDDIATASCVMLNDVALGSDLNIVRSDLCGPFFSYYLNGSKRFDIAKVAQGDTVAHLYPGQLKKIEVSYPELSEQQMIADCLSSLDDLIAAHRRKLSALKAHKKGLMQQLFPREGETLPRLRFPEFKDAPDFHKTTLAEVCDMKAGDFVRASNIHDKQEADMYPCYGGNGLRGYTKSFTHTETYPLIGRQGALCGNVNLLSGKFHATEHALVATPNDGVDLNWLFYALGFMNLNQFAIGQAQPGLSVGRLNDLSLLAPADEAEQTIIAGCLSSADELIDRQELTINALSTHKTGLMQQLFPTIEDVI